MRILVVEDEKKVASFIQRGLEEEGFQVDVADDGEEGLYMAESNPYDLILMDLDAAEDGWPGRHPRTAQKGDHAPRSSA